jgi:hypothetical protein
MRTALIAIATLVIGYIAGAALGGVATAWLSSITHDLSVEAAMTGAFVTGPATGILAALAYLVFSRRAAQ